jgi:tetratricopeptide (TPR) repeat protein
LWGQIHVKYLAHLGAAVVLVFLTLAPGFAQDLPANAPQKETQDQAQDFLRRAEIAWRQGRFQVSAQAYRQALKIKPDLALAHYGLGLALARLQKYQEAVTSFQAAVQYEPKWATARKDLGVAYLKLKRWPQAGEAFKTSLQYQPEDPEVFYNLGVALGKMGKHQEALEAFEEAVRLKPEYVAALNNLGMANVKLNRWAEAKRYFGQALELKPDNPEAHLGLLACYIQEGDRQAATRTYQKLVSLDKGLARKADELMGK